MCWCACFCVHRYGHRITSHVLGGELWPPRAGRGSAAPDHYAPVGWEYLPVLVDRPRLLPDDSLLLQYVRGGCCVDGSEKRRAVTHVLVRFPHHDSVWCDLASRSRILSRCCGHQLHHVQLLVLPQFRGKEQLHRAPRRARVSCCLACRLDRRLHAT